MDVKLAGGAAVLPQQVPPREDKLRDCAGKLQMYDVSKKISVLHPGGYETTSFGTIIYPSGCFPDISNWELRNRGESRVKP